MPEHPPGVIALACGELGRYHAFTLSLASLTHPYGTRIHMVQSLSIARNFNIIANEMLATEHLQWMFLQADDQVFEPDCLWRLLAREVEVVVPLITRRHPPFAPVIFKEETDEGYLAFAYDELPSEGLLEVYAAGTGGMLIRRSVFERLREQQGHETFFEFSAGDIVNEDTEFCRKLRALEVPIHCDVEVRMGHCSTFIAWPQIDDEGKWGIHFQMGEGPDGAVRGIFVKPGERVPEFV